jgi:hypothetical protein
MKEIDDSIPPKPDLERPVTVEQWGLTVNAFTKNLTDLDIKLSRDLDKWIPRILDLEDALYQAQNRIMELEAQVEDLHATDSARRVNLTTEDPEWY